MVDEAASARPESEVPATLLVEPKPVEKKSDKASAEDEEQSAFKEWVELLVRAGTWAMLIYLFLFQVSVVHGDSMNPTFNGNDAEGKDKLVIDKLTYRFSDIKRNDMIVFEAIDLDKKPRRPQDYIKRVIGLPGETVEIKDGSVWVGTGGKLVKLDEPKDFGPTYTGSWLEGQGSQSWIVPPRHYFVMGDNRRYSKDSRVEGRQTLGFVPERQIRGLVRIRFWPFSRWSWFSRAE